MHNRPNLRFFTQVVFFILIGAIVINKALADAGMAIPLLSTASLHSICPFGGVVTLYNLVTVGTFVQKIHVSAVVLMGLVFFLAVLFGPVFCGWVCPLGTIQEWTGKLGKKLFRKRYNHFVPKRIDRILRYLRYVVLLWVIYVTARSGSLIFADFDPYVALFTFWSEEVALPAILILIGTLVLSLFVERPWCKYLCPYGALLGLFNKIRLIPIRRNQDTCISCSKCDRVCPMNLSISDQETVRDTQCISCFECTSQRQCPVPDALDVKAGGVKKGRTVSLVLLSLLIFGILAGGIFATMELGVWATSSDKTPAKYQDGELSGTYDPSDIRGSYTFQEVSDLFEIDLATLYQAFGIPEETDGNLFYTKDLESLYGDMGVEIGNESVQVFVALYKNLPIELGETYLLREGTELILQNNPDLTEEQRAYLESHTLNPNSTEPALPLENAGDQENPEAVKPATQEPQEQAANGGSPNGGSASNPDGTEEDKPLVTGTTTFQQVLDGGVTKEQIEQVIGGSLPFTNQTVKDYCTEKGLTFSLIKEELNSLAP